MRNYGNKIGLFLFILSGCNFTSQLGSHFGSHESASPNLSTQASTTFPVSVDGLSEVKSMSEVSLSDGENYLLEAKAAKQKIGDQWIRRLSYNGSVPGPIFRVKQGSTVRMTLKNSTEVDTTLHPHGLRVDFKNDGVPGIGQDPIKPGESFEYVLKFPDAGIYWYHPHVREDYAQEAGLYGIFIVEPIDSSAFNPVHREIPLILDDVRIDPTQPFKSDVVNNTLMGRYGNVNLVNGVVNPTISVTKGEVIRFYVLNTANTRVFSFAIPRAKVKLVGSDNGLYETEKWADQVVLGPGERAIVEVQFSEVGKYEIRNNNPKNPASIAQIDVQDGQVASLGNNFEELHSNSSAVKELGDIRTQLQRSVDKTLKISIAMDGMGGMGGMDHGTMGSGGMGNMGGMDHSSGGMDHTPTGDGIEWDDEMADMNKSSTNKNITWQLIDEETSTENMDIRWTFKKGQYARIRIFNDPDSMHPMQHPIHFHGQRFVVASIDGQAQSNLVWKDTALVPTGATVDIILEISNLGKWMAHCHIAEHLEAQMMFGFEVVD